MLTKKELEDATELLGLDVRYVSGVTTPATGKPFILSKSVQGEPMAKKMSWEACIAKQTEAGADDPEAVCFAMHAQTPKGKSKKLEELEGEDIEAGENQSMDDVEKSAIEDYDAFYAENEVEKHGDHNQKRHGWRYGQLGGTSKRVAVNAVPSNVKSKADRKAYFETLARRRGVKKDANSDLLRDLAYQLAKMFGFKSADETLAEANQALAVIAQKAQGELPVDDTGLPKAKYPKPKYDAGDGIPSTTDNPKVASESYKSKVVQNPEVVDGKAYAGSADEDDVTEGKPVTKDYIQEFISRLEGQAVNKEAMQVAKEALEQAFTPPQEGEDNMREEEVRDLMLKALEPIIDAVEELQAQDQVVAKSAAVESLTEKVDELSKQVGDLTDIVLMLKERNGAGAALRPVQKSRVPANVTASPRKEAGVWSNSPFDVAAGY